jgi:hypothetical protein
MIYFNKNSKNFSKYIIELFNLCFFQKTKIVFKTLSRSFLKNDSVNIRNLFISKLNFCIIFFNFIGLINF